MNRFTPVPASSRIYYHHWLAYWKPLAAIASLLVLGMAGLMLWPLVGAGMLAFSLVVGAALHLWRSWHTLTFLDDGRLVRRRDVGGCAQDVISLFGVITPYQIPVVGRWLDAGSVHLGIPGPDIHIRHIGNFRAFCTQLFSSVQQEERSQTSVQVVLVWPPVPGDNRQWAVHPPPQIPAPRPEPPNIYVMAEEASELESWLHR